VTDDECSELVSTLMRFSECQNPLSHLRLSALAPIYLEHGFYGDYLGPKAPNYSDDPVSFGRLARTSIQRLCDRVDAVVILARASPGCERIARLLHSRFGDSAL